MKRFMALAAVVLSLAATLRADVKLPAVISDGMVLQREAVVPVWGWAEPGEKVIVTVAGQTKAAAADAEGNWQVRLDALEAGGPHTMTVKGNNTLTVKNILVGEVWLCSGQSNMAMTVGRAKDAAKEAAAAKFPSIRHFSVRRTGAATPQKDCKGAWAVCSPTTVRSFSATAYFFGRHLHKKLDVPIGLINSSVGGTPIEAWTPAAAAQKPKDADVEKAKKAYEERLAKWKEASAKAKAAGKRPPRRPRAPSLGASGGGLYNGMVAPLRPFALRGAIWYQGERNTRTNAYAYRKLLPTLIQRWRAAWAQGDFPFLWVQLPNWRGHGAETWAVIRESMLQALAVPNTGMAITIDVGDPKNIHPKNKQAVGTRLALVARGVAYGETLVYSGPLFDALKVDGGKARLSFKHVGDGLVAKGGALEGFAIAGDDRKFVPATAAIEGAEVVVSSPQVAKPVAIRYAWANNPVCNLTNKAGLPASPFRTDTWPVASQPKK